MRQRPKKGSDGTSSGVSGIPADGDVKPVDFPEKTVRWVQYAITSFSGEEPGLAEFVVLGPSAAYASGNLASAATVAGTNGARVTDGSITGAAGDSFLQSETVTTLTIVDDDRPPPTVSLSASPNPVPEGGTVTVTATLSSTLPDDGGYRTAATSV